jgi:hypothetical protein
MIRIGDMVRAAGPPMKLVGFAADGSARCLLIDQDGAIRYRYHDLKHLMPMWQSLQPRCLWPETGQLDLLEIDKEERAAQAARAAERKAAKKSRPSNKLKRRALVVLA